MAWLVRSLCKRRFHRPALTVKRPSCVIQSSQGSAFVPSNRSSKEVGRKLAHLQQDAVGAAQPDIEPRDIGGRRFELHTAVADAQIRKAQRLHLTLHQRFQTKFGRGDQRN